ncbi:hypothetical protein OIU84_001972 [Salix udensis]|uniref:NAB domain-containing protein n=1 Tax=Salix udensis TaxID=889485 RepID=A0AAD6K868_9ROSI|nr:hypothetical protein OIU84_001972 [Salix udensis]
MGDISSIQTTPVEFPADGADERVKMVLECLRSEEDMGCGDSFAERAEWYYQKRPQLLALLRDLYSGYTALLDRCSRMERGKKLSNHFSSPMLMALDDDHDQEGSGGSSSSQFLDWDVESSLSYQHSATPVQDGSDAILGVDEVVADLVMKNVENDILADQLGEMEKNQQGQESIWRKVELLKKLLEVLESERIVLLNENVRLGYKMQTLLEENKGLSSESMFLKRKAEKIEDLQGQIYGLEMRNKEYYQQLLKKELREEENISCTSSSSSSRKDGGVAFVGCCFQIEKLKLKKKDGASVGKKWWRNVKNMNLFMCGFQ